MKTLTVALTLAAVATGAAGAAIAYASTAPQASTQSTISTRNPAPQAAVDTRPGVKREVRFRKCRVGARLEHGKCVRHVVRTVVEAAPAVAADPTPTSSRSTGRSPAGRGEHGDRPPKIRQSTGERPRDEGDDHEGNDSDGHELEGSEDHGSHDSETD